MLWTEARDLPDVAARMHACTPTHHIGSQLPELTASSAIRIKQSPFSGGCKKGWQSMYSSRQTLRTPLSYGHLLPSYYCQLRP